MISSKCHVKSPDIMLCPTLNTFAPAAYTLSYTEYICYSPLVEGGDMFCLGSSVKTACMN